MEDFKKEEITRAALGRLGFIGELYDARNESLSSRSLFKSSLPASAIESRDLGRMEFDYSFTENISDWFDLIKVEGELRLGILCGLIQLEGSGKFLTDQKKSEKTVSCTLICKFETVCEKFYAAWNEILNYVDLKALEDVKSTHVVVECYWGANCLLSMECYCNSESEKRDVKSSLGADIKIFSKLCSIKGDFEFEKIRGNLSCKNDIHIKVNADVLPEDKWPTTPEDFCEFVREVPKLLRKVNGGKGKPLKYVMIPLSTIRKLAKVECALECLVVQIGESFLLSTVYFFDEIGMIKRKFYDRLSEMDKCRKYVLTKDYQECKTELRNLLLKESTLKQIIADNWASVRSGTMSLRDLIRAVEKFKNEFDLIKYESYFDFSQKILNKLSFIKNFLSKGIIYLGLGETFSELLAQSPTSDFIVFITSGVTIESELCQKTLNYFLTLKEHSESSIKFVVVDVDYRITFLDDKIKPPKCVHLKGSQLLNQDLYAQYMHEKEMNFAMPKKGTNTTYAAHKPGKRVKLEMVCPNFQNDICSSDVIEWTCYRCKIKIEYGFDEFFYCSCGKVPAFSFTFKCADSKHGHIFVAPEEKFLKEMLSNLRPFKEMNLLLLGQSGVGKSTWLNSIINYLNYDSLEDAESSGVICTTPVCFGVYDTRALKKEIVSVGEESDKENTETGNGCHTYSFVWENRLVRLIDTPGLGDARGIEQDKKNILHVMTYIAHLNELHGVCILLKATDNRSTGFFSYCFKELLIHFHKNVTRNIVFCFTNARSTFYAPGQVAVILENVIKRLGITRDLGLGHHNMFCLDNESFIYLCSLKYSDVRFEGHLKTSFLESWKISQQETKRLFHTLIKFQPHALKETMALFNAKSRILSSVRLLTNVSKTIHTNITIIEEKQKEIQNSDERMKNLSQKLTVQEIHLEQEQLIHPRTVCTKPFCVRYIPLESSNATEIEYTTHCHSECTLKDVELRTTNNYRIRNCSAMINGICKVCGCSWEYHMHIEIAQKRIVTELKDVKVEKDINEKKSEQRAVEDVLKNLKTLNEKYKYEHDFIVQATEKLGMFLKVNAIMVYNDSMADYLQFLIQEKENKGNKSEADRRLLKSMKDTLASHEEEVKIFEKVVNVNKVDNLTVDDINDLDKKLFSLELTGEEIKNSALANRNAQNGSYKETMIQLKNRSKPSTIYQKIMSKIWPEKEEKYSLIYDNDKFKYMTQKLYMG